jgi:hypothetical protein
MILDKQTRGSLRLELLVRHKVDGAVADSCQAGYEAAEVCAPSLFAGDGAQADEHGGVGSLVVRGGGEHAGLDYPDGVGQGGGEDARGEGGGEVVERGEGRVVLWVAVEMSEHILGLGVPEEIEGPAEGVADQVWRQTAVEGAERGGAFGSQEGVEDAEGGQRGEDGPGSGLSDGARIGVDCGRGGSASRWAWGIHRTHMYVYTYICKAGAVVP